MYVEETNRIIHRNNTKTKAWTYRRHLRYPITTNDTTISTLRSPFPTNITRIITYYLGTFKTNLKLIKYHMESNASWYQMTIISSQTIVRQVKTRWRCGWKNKPMFEEVSQMSDVFKEKCKFKWKRPKEWCWYAYQVLPDARWTK